MTKKTILVLDPISQALELALGSALDREKYTIVVAGKKAEEDDKAVKTAEVLMCSSTDIDSELLDRARNVRLILHYQAGRSKIDRQMAEGRAIRVVEVPCLAFHSVAEFAVMSMLALPKRYVTACLDTRKQVWLPDLQPALTTSSSYAYNWVDLPNWDSIYGKTVGLVGMGTVGRAVVELLQGFGVEVIYTDVHRLDFSVEQELGISYTELDELLRRSDFVSLHVKFTEDTEKLLGMREFSKMKSSAFFINTSRGRVVDEDALAQALIERRLAGAALDVFRMEPLPKESPLWKLDNVIITPHVAGIPLGAAAETEAKVISREIANCCC